MIVRLEREIDVLYRIYWKLKRIGDNADSMGFLCSFISLIVDITRSKVGR